MLFCTEKFLIFFLVVFRRTGPCPGRAPECGCCWPRVTTSTQAGTPSLARLIFLTTICDYFIARGMDATAVPWRRKAAHAVAASSAISAYCVTSSTRTSFSTRSATPSLPRARPHRFGLLSVILPVGISFYTFEAISYTVDVYRGKIPAERNLDHFLLFILFFPAPGRGSDCPGQ